MIVAAHSMGGMHMGGHASAGHRAATHAMAGMSMGPEPPINLHTLLTDWQTGVFPISAGIILVAIAVWYVLAVGNLAGRGRHW
jgi:hypothetical protein